MTIPERERAKVVAAMSRRHLTCQDVARMTGLNLRTIQRFVRAETFHLETLAHIEAALRLPVSDGGTPIDSAPPMSTNVHQAARLRPVMGWYRAADVLGVSYNTLRRRRVEADDRTRIPMWRSEEALWKWFEGLNTAEVG